MRTPPKHLKPTKRNQRKLERAIEAAKKAKVKEAALIEKYEQQIAKDLEKNNRTQQKMFGDKTASASKPMPVAPAAMPKREAQKVPAPIPAPAFEEEDEDEYEEEGKRRGGIFFTIAGIVFLLIAVGMILWQFRVFDGFFQKPNASAVLPAFSAAVETEFQL